MKKREREKIPLELSTGRPPRRLAASLRKTTTALRHDVWRCNNRPTRTTYICTHKSMYDKCRNSILLLNAVDLSIQSIGAFDRVPDIWLVDDVDDSSMPLSPCSALFSRASWSTHQTVLQPPPRPATTDACCTVIDTPLNLAGRLFQGFAHH